MDAESEKAHAGYVLLEDGLYICTLCGAAINLTQGEKPLAMIKASSERPSMRVITLAGKELHACPLELPNKGGPRFSPP